MGYGDRRTMDFTVRVLASDEADGAGRHFSDRCCCCCLRWRESDEKKSTRLSDFLSNFALFITRIYLLFPFVLFHFYPVKNGRMIANARFFFLSLSSSSEFAYRVMNFNDKSKRAPLPAYFLRKVSGTEWKYDAG
ncbi:hypothetical protein TSAR_000176 [Trichomalopsis sarcophagae]|uniref:Uncharacterized protein n=1 Tax=Trichomalopsis sarcophagae TaxID=543379 RepID=A0A232FAD9_9HYME|nr:hypothetical protein TSAR_000176 [Trichomalopsis sarcophagae]